MTTTDPLPRYLRLIRFSAGLFQIIAAGALFFGLLQLGALLVSGGTTGDHAGLRVRLKEDFALSATGEFSTDAPAPLKLGLAVGRLEVPPEAFGLRVFANLDFVIGGALVLFGAWIIRRAATEANGRDPFHRQNLRRLQQLAWVYLGAWLWLATSSVIGQMLASHTLGFVHGAPTAVLLLDAITDPTLWFGIVILAGAEIFRQGISLREENDLTV